MLNHSKLSKLLKYDFQAIFKYFLPMSIFILIYSCIGTLLFKVGDSETFSQNTLLNIFSAFVIGVYVLSIIAYSIVTQVLIVVNFYKSMVTDTGYLTHTLPVKKSSILLSKLISGCVVLLISYAVLISCIAIMVDLPSNLITYRKEIAAALEIGNETLGTSSIIRFVLTLIFSAVIGTIQSLSMYFVSVAFGQLMNRHKAVGSLAAFFVLSFALQIFSSVLSFMFQGVFENMDTFSLSRISNLVFGGTLGMLVISILMLIATHYIFSRKLNLE